MTSDDKTFDLIVIGSGPGGYVAAIRAGQLGMKTAVVEKDSNLGGTCLNVGCIPSKALLHSTEMARFARNNASDHGIRMDGLSIDLEQVMAKKSKAVDQLRGGVRQLLKKNGVTVFEGHGQLDGEGQVRVFAAKDEFVLGARHIVIATGSAPVELPFMPFDGKSIVSSDDAIAFDEVPEQLVVVGAGAIGLELGAVWSRLGSEVTVVEFLPRVAPAFDKDVSRLVQRMFKKQGLKFHLETQVTGAERHDDGKLKLSAEGKQGAVEFEADKVLVAVGRRPFTQKLGLESVGIETDDNGRVPVDGAYRAADGVYAIGDVIPGVMLAHKAEEEGVACVERIAGQAGHVNYDVIPNVIYTEPEIASAGLSEEEAAERGHEVRAGTFNLAANGRAIATDATEGMVKVIADAESDRLLGVQIVAKSASELIASAVTHMEYGGSAEDLGRTIHAHPTLAESVKEAGLAVGGHAIHGL